MANRRLLTAPSQGLRHTVTAIGDSLTHNYTLGVDAQNFWTEILAAELRALGAGVRVRGFGHSGNTSLQIENRQAELTEYEVPDIGIIWAGVNDPGNSIPGANTQANIGAILSTLKAAGVGRALVLNTQYLNYSTGGDTPTTPYATYATLRPFQAAAVAAFAGDPVINVQLVDLYSYMKAIITGATPVTVGSTTYTVPANAQSTPAVDAASFNWHVADTNQHLNVLGNQIVANAVLAAIQSQPGWLAALQA